MSSTQFRIFLEWDFSDPSKILCVRTQGATVSALCPLRDRSPRCGVGFDLSEHPLEPRCLFGQQFDFILIVCLVSLFSLLDCCLHCLYCRHLVHTFCCVLLKTHRCYHLCSYRLLNIFNSLDVRFLSLTGVPDTTHACTSDAVAAATWLCASVYLTSTFSRALEDCVFSAFLVSSQLCTA